MLGKTPKTFNAVNMILAPIGKGFAVVQLLIKSGDQRDFFAQLFERFLFPALFVPASDIPAARPRNLKGSAKNALSASQKVGRTVENIVSASNHKDILSPHGCECH